MYGANAARCRWQWVYGILTAAVFILSVSRFVLFFEAAVSASTGLHNKILTRCAPAGRCEMLVHCLRLVLA